MSHVLFYGDPHGAFVPLNRACQAERPDAVVIVGDLELEIPLSGYLEPLREARIPVRWMLGNHDTDTRELFEFIWDDHRSGNLHACFAHLGGLNVAGLGGVFRERVWYPRDHMATPVHATRRDYVRRPGYHRFRGGLWIRDRDTIFPEDLVALGKLRVDVLATHEAPTTHRHGLVGIDAAARACRARMIVHGHHHESYAATLPDGTRVRGLATAEVFRLRPEDLA